MNKFVRFLILLVIVSLSCSSVTDLFTEPGLVEVTGPILGMTVAASIDDQGQPVDASFSYPTDQPEMVVLVHIGEVDPGPLTFSWYRVTEAGDEPLFEQTVAVAANEGAFSTGLNPGILAAGAYKVVATFAEGSETIVWDVVELQTDDLTAQLDTSESAAGGTPAPGPSGTTPVVVPQPGPQDITGPATESHIFSNDPLEVKFLVLSSWMTDASIVIPSPISFTVRVSAAITGFAPRVIGEHTHPASSGPQGELYHKNGYSVNPCTLSGERDLPGTGITVTTFALGYEALRRSDIIVLGPDTSLPIVAQLISEPSNRVPVKAGDVIGLTAIAEELRSGGSWQTGVSKIVIQVMNPSGVAPFSVPYAEYAGKSCEAKSWKQTTRPEYRYTVPEGVEGDVKICAFAEDFAGNQSQKKCYTYPTGNQVKGTLKSTIKSSSDVGTNVNQEDADLSLDLKPDGTLTGTAKITYAFHGEGTLSDGCPWSASIDPVQVTLPVTGKWTEDTLVFRYTTAAPIMAAETTITCDNKLTVQVPVPILAGADWHAAWDGQKKAYTADKTSSTRGADWTSEHHWTINLAPPAPAVGFNPGTWSAAGGDQVLVDLTYP